MLIMPSSDPTLKVPQGCRSALAQGSDLGDRVVHVTEAAAVIERVHREGSSIGKVVDAPQQLRNHMCHPHAVAVHIVGSDESSPILLPERTWPRRRSLRACSLCVARRAKGLRSVRPLA